MHVGFAAHGTDVDDLLESKDVRRHAGVDRVREFDVVLLVSLDDGGRMHAGGGAERIIADNGVVGWNRNARGARDRDAVVLETGEVLRGPGRNSHQLEIDEHQIHLRVPDTLAHT